MTRDSTVSALAAQLNLGPKSAAMLVSAGVNSSTALRRLGSVRTYLKVKRANPSASLNLLWALEGALTNTHWREVAKNRRIALLIELDDALRARRPTATPKRGH